MLNFCKIPLLFLEKLIQWQTIKEISADLETLKKKATKKFLTDQLYWWL